MGNKNRQILFHVIGCVAFLSLPVLFSRDRSWSFDFLRVAPFQRDFISYSLLLVFFYLNYFLFIPNYYFKKQYGRFTICIVLCFGIVTLLPDMLIPRNHRPFDIDGNPGNFQEHTPPAFNDGRFPDASSGEVPRHRPPMPGMFDLRDSSQHLFQFIIVFVLSLMIRINKRLRQSEQGKINAELSYLKAQINPHFLFNTLNGIYSSAITENAEHTASAIVKLSGMMRYVISETHNDYVPLEKEIRYIRDYIELQEVRLGNTVQLSYDITGDMTGKKIAPLILISFIENAFKYGVNPEADSSIRIAIDIRGNELKMEVVNRIVGTGAENVRNGIGLENTANRLQLLYPSRHLLKIDRNENNFFVSLKIQLQ